MTAKASRVAAATIALITFVAFLPTLHNGFVTWDDDRNFLDNPAYRGLGITQLKWMWTTFHLGHYVPLSWMTLGADYTLWGMDARGYHLTNLLLHCGSTVILYFIALRLIRACIGERANENPAAASLSAATAALLFAVHPLRVESVAWVTERRDVLSLLFMSASLLCYLRFVERDRRRDYAFSLVLFACALLSKATSLTLPAVMLILNVYPLRRFPARRVYLEIAPFAVLAAATIPLTLIALAPGVQLPFVSKLAVSAYGLGFYLWKTVLPTGLSPLYAMPKHVDPFAGRYVFAAVAVVAGIVAAWFARRRYPSVATAVAVFLVLITPMLGVVQNGPQIAADRYTYHASPALAILVGGAMFPLFAASGVVIWRLVTGAAVVALMALTWRQSGVWHDPERFWSYVLSRDSSSSLAHTMLANMALRDNRLDDAIAHYSASVRLDSTFVDSHDNLGIALARQGRFEEAAREFHAALAINPRDREIHNNLGVADSHLGRFEEAMAEFQAALSIDPTYAEAEINWGNALVSQHRPADAVPHYAAAVRLDPGSADAHLNWGVALAQQGKMVDAAEHFRRVLELDPGNAQAGQYLAAASRKR